MLVFFILIQLVTPLLGRQIVATVPTQSGSSPGETQTPTPARRLSQITDPDDCPQTPGYVACCGGPIYSNFPSKCVAKLVMPANWVQYVDCACEDDTPENSCYQPASSTCPYTWP